MRPEDSQGAVVAPGSARLAPVPAPAVPAVKLRGITKRFGPVTALDNVHFDLAAGEIHGLLGENGAGKTTLARVAAGLLVPDAGTAEVAGQPIAFGSVGDSRSLGVSMVHQHFSLVPRFTGLENIALCDRDAWTRRGTAAPGYRRRVEERASELSLAVEFDVPAGEMSVGARQRIEILKALTGEPRVLLLDEPTAVLAPQEVEGLFAVLRRLASSGTAIVLVAHKLDEVLAVADRVTVLRRGKRVLAAASGNTSAEELAEAMIGSLPTAGPGNRPAIRDTEQAPVATITEVTSPVLRGVSLVARRGEVLGIAGVEGNGQRELARVLAGVTKPDSGEVRLPNEVGWIPQDRSEEGLVGRFSLTENVALALHRKPTFRAGPWLNWRSIRAETAALIDEMDVRAQGPDTRAETLSGGNQQKLLTGRELLCAGDLLVAESPTRGLDLKASRYVRDRIAQTAWMARPGKLPASVVLFSADLDEIVELSDRIAVMVRGRLIHLPPTLRSPAEIGAIMLGAPA